MEVRTALDREHYYAGEPVIGTVEVCNRDVQRPAQYEMNWLEGEFGFFAENEHGAEQVFLFAGRSGDDGDIRELPAGTCLRHRFEWDRTRNGEPVDPGPWVIMVDWLGWQFHSPPVNDEEPRRWVGLHDGPRPENEPRPVDDDRDYTHDVTFDLELDAQTYRAGDPVAFTIRMCNATDRDLTWEYSEKYDRPVTFGLYQSDDHMVYAELRNGYEPEPGEVVGVQHVRLPAQECLSWSGIWKQTRGRFELDGRSDGEAFGPGDVVAHGTPEGHCVEYDVRMPQDEVRFSID